MDTKTAARVKVNARLVPAKEIQNAYSSLLSNTDPEKFEELKQTLLLAIDSAEAEYNLLNQETSIMSDAIPKWEEEIGFATQEIEKFQEEMTLLLQEKQELEEKRAEVEQIEKMKSEIAKNDPSKKLKEIHEIEEKNKTDEADIQEAEKKNERRRIGLNKIQHGLRIFNGNEDPEEQQQPAEQKEEQPTQQPPAEQKDKPQPTE